MAAKCMSKEQGHVHLLHARRNRRRRGLSPAILEEAMVAVSFHHLLGLLRLLGLELYRASKVVSELFHQQGQMMSELRLAVVIEVLLGLLKQLGLNS